MFAQPLAEVSSFRVQRRASFRSVFRAGKHSFKTGDTNFMFIPGARLIVDPDSMFYHAWVNVMPFMALVSTYMSPFMVAFTSVAHIGVVQYVVFMIDFVFLVDMLVAARLAHYTSSGEQLVVEQWAVLKNYLRRRVWFDLAMNFPFIEVVALLKGTVIITDEDVFGFVVVLRLLRWEKIYNFLVGLNLN
eukprot:evm.model.scf_2498.1 EVM.evm.TU.scf_2498.1   scf_2498:12583-15500(-)